MIGGRRVFLASALLALGLAVPAYAQDTDEPGSVLVFPLVDSTAGAGTIVCVTNTNTDRLFCPLSDQRIGDVLLHYFYVDGDTWLEFDRYEFLTPGDTLCVVASEHNLDPGRGFLVISAHDPNGEALLGFDHLVGSAIVVESSLNFLWTYRAFSMKSGTAKASCNAVDPDSLGEGGDGDGVPDFDGTEYSAFPRTLLVDTFFEEGGNHGFENRLVLLSTSGSSYANEIDFLFFNNIEQKFSRSFEFTCWWSGPLSDISSVAGDLRGNPSEFGHKTETGWVRIEGSRIVDGAGNPVPNISGGPSIPAILGVFMQGIEGTDYAFGKSLHFEGAIDGMELQRGDSDPQLGS